MYRAIIIDDELIGINTLKILIEKHFDTVKVIATTTDPNQGITLIENYKPDIVFLDISMPQMSGFDLLGQLNFKNFKLVFTTAHEEYAIKAIKNKAYDYLLKPIDISELKQCIHNITNDSILTHEKKRKPSGIIELSVKDGIIFIKPGDIIRLEGSGSYTIIYLINNVKYMASKGLKEYEAILDFSEFYRCHISHIINLNKVVKLKSTDGLFIQMIDGSEVELAKKNKQTFLEKLKNI